MSIFRREIQTDRYLMGQATANADIAEFGVEFSESFLLAGVEFVTDGFLDGYSRGIQDYYTRGK